MNLENNPISSPKKSTINRIVEFVTGGRYGVDETIENGYKDELTGEIFSETPVEHALITGDIVVVLDKNKTTHVIGRQIVRRHTK